MKVVFLDIDGVLNTERFINIQKKELGGIYDRTMNLNFDPICMKNLKKIIELTGTKIVISSTWRKSKESNGIHWKAILQNFRQYKIDENVIIGITPFIDFGTRGEEIKEWINEHKVEKFAIIDDLDNEKVDNISKNHLILCNSYWGIRDNDVEKVIEIL